MDKDLTAKTAKFAKIKRTFFALFARFAVQKESTFILVHLW